MPQNRTSANQSRFEAIMDSDRINERAFEDSDDDSDMVPDEMDDHNRGNNVRVSSGAIMHQSSPQSHMNYVQ